MRYVCPLCGEVYDEESAGIPLADLPEEWRCPLCFAPKDSFAPDKLRGTYTNPVLTGSFPPMLRQAP